MACFSRKSSINIGAMALAVFLATGCAKPIRVPMAEELKPQINSAKTLSGMETQELQVSIDVSTGGQAFGLIGAIVDAGVNNSRTKSAESEVVPVRDALLGYDPSAPLASALSKELSQVFWLKNNTVEVKPMSDISGLPSWIEKSESDVLVLVRTDYRLTPKFDGVTVTAWATVHPRATSLVPQQKPFFKMPGVLYANLFSVTYTLPNFPSPNPTLGDAAKLLAEEKGQKAKEMIDLGLAELAQMIAFDLQQPGTVGEELYKAPANAKQVTKQVGPLLLAGHVVRESNGRQWVRCPDGRLISVKQ